MTMSIMGLALQEKKKIEIAQKEFQKIVEEIAPFVKRRELKRYSTKSEWKLTDAEL